MRKVKAGETKNILAGYYENNSKKEVKGKYLRGTAIPSK